MMSSEPDTEADTEICSGSSRIPSSSTKSEGKDVVVSAAQGQGQGQNQGQVQAQAQAQVQDMPFSSGETLVANDPHSHSHAGNGATGTSSVGGQDKRPNVRVPADIKDDPQTETLCENNDPTSTSTIPDTTAPPVAPSLSRPDEGETTSSPSSSSSLPRLVRKRAVENLHDESVREGHSPNPNANTIPSKSQSHAPRAPRARYSWLPKTKTGLRPASTIELGAACRRQSPPPPPPGAAAAAAQEASVIIDSNGARHTITAAEEAARDEDLRDAVGEKMATGRIRAKPQSQPQSKAGTRTGTGLRAKPRPVSMSTSGTAFDTLAGNNGRTGRRAASSPFTYLDGAHGKSCTAASASVVTGSAPRPGVGSGTGNGNSNVNANANANGNGNGLKAKDSTSGRSPFEPTKRRSILQKLSFLGFGRQKDKDVIGFGRIVEAA